MMSEIYIQIIPCFHFIHLMISTSILRFVDLIFQNYENKYEFLFNIQAHQCKTKK